MSNEIVILKCIVIRLSDTVTLVVFEDVIKISRASRSNTTYDFEVRSLPRLLQARKVCVENEIDQ